MQAAQPFCRPPFQLMRQKVALAGALVHEPRIIILALHRARRRLRPAGQTVLREHVAAGGTVIMTTHILEVAERMADRIGVIARGRLIAQGTLEELRRQAGHGSSSLQDSSLQGLSLEDTFLALVAAA
jgi:ABC-2 type transport system ATP-binding protein